jgi:plasmid stabilization system protein ParE
MAKRNVIWTKTADIQFNGVLAFWVQKNNSNSYSLKLLKLVSERINQIAKFPYLYKASNFKDHRVSSLGHFSIYYKITNKQIIITAFWDNRQDPQELLKVLRTKL